MMGCGRSILITRPIAACNSKGLTAIIILVNQHHCCVFHSFPLCIAGAEFEAHFLARRMQKRGLRLWGDWAAGPEIAARQFEALIRMLYLQCRGSEGIPVKFKTLHAGLRLKGSGASGDSKPDRLTRQENLLERSDLRAAR
jgi:hypothetical protein